MKFKVSHSGFIRQVRFGRNESGHVVSYGDILLCADVHTVLRVDFPDKTDVKMPAPQSEALLLTDEALIGLWEEVSQRWYGRKGEAYEKLLLVPTGLFFTHEKQDYALLATAQRWYAAVKADFVRPFLAAQTHDFYLCFDELRSSTKEVTDVAAALSLPLIVAAWNSQLTAFTAPATIPQRQLHYLAKASPSPSQSETLA